MLSNKPMIQNALYYLLNSEAKKYTIKEIRKRKADAIIFTTPKLNVSKPQTNLIKRKVKKLKPKKNTQNARKRSLFFFNFFKSKSPKIERTRESNGTQIISGKQKL